MFPRSRASLALTVFALALAPAREVWAQASQPAPRPSAAPVGPEAASAQVTLIFEIDENHIKVQEMWQIRNTGAGPLPASALVFPLGDVRRLSLDEESQASFTSNEPGTIVRATRDLPPGATLTFAGSYLLDRSGRAEATMARPFPVPVGGGRVILEDIGSLEVSGSTSFSARVRDLNGLSFRVFDFGGLPAGHAFRLDIAGLPSRTTLPRDIAVILCVAAFAWMIVQVAQRRPQAAAVRVLGSLSPEARRDQLVRALELLEEDRRVGRVEGKKLERRRKALMGELASVLREIELDRGA